MSPVLFVLGALAGGAGAALRYVGDVLISRLLPPPWGVFVINVLGSFVLGILTGAAVSAEVAFLTGAAVSAEVAFLVGAGLLGGFTTFSAVSVTTVLLAEEQRTRLAIVNAVGTFAVAVGAAWAGVALGSALIG